MITINCILCDRTFRTQDNLRQHLRAKHINLDMTLFHYVGIEYE